MFFDDETLCGVFIRVLHFIELVLHSQSEKKTQHSRANQLINS